MPIALALFAWFPIVVLMFCALPPARAAVAALVGGCLFLPPAGFHIGGLPEYSKIAATALPVLLVTPVFAPELLLRFRPRWLDLPMAVWCICPFFSSMANNLGPYDGASAAAEHALDWGLPYLVGRLYLDSLPRLRELTLGLVLGGLVYAPLCLWEIRMSPKLCLSLYGICPSRGIEYFMELGSWGSRPNVFMGNALATGMFMTAAALGGLWLWRTGAVTRLWRWPAGAAATFLLFVTVLGKNLGALSLLMLGLSALFVARRSGLGIVVFPLIAAAPLYMAARGTGKWSGHDLAEAAGEIHASRGESLQFRLDNEDRLVAKALERPGFGWGRWGRARVYREDGTDISITDGLWVIALGNTGLVGLSAVTTAMLLPAALIFWRLPTRLWAHPDLAPATALAMILVLYALDNLFNAMPNGVYMFTIGGLVNLAAVLRRATRTPVTAVRARAGGALRRLPRPG